MVFDLFSIKSEINIFKILDDKAIAVELTKEILCKQDQKAYQKRYFFLK